MEFRINDYLEQLVLGEPWIRENLMLVPVLIKEESDLPKYILLDEALEAGSLKIKEASEHGNVNEILVINEGDKPVLILDGEELIGAKQNRMLNASILIPSHTQIIIPVSCVERGRWRYESDTFNKSEVFVYPFLRYKKAVQVTGSLMYDESFASNQEEVWEEINRKQARMKSHSATEAMHDIYIDYEKEIEKYMEDLKPLAQQIGIMAVVNGKYSCLDCFSHRATLSKLFKKLVTSYVMEALEERKGKVVNGFSPQQIISKLRTAKGYAFKSPGQGFDIRLHTPGFIGAGLLSKQILHLSVFRHEVNGRTTMSNPGRRARRYESNQ